MGKHSYRSGCRCRACRSKEALRQRNYRARRAAAAPKAALTVLPTAQPAPSVPGEVEAAVVVETAPYVEDRPAAVAQAKRLGQVLDDAGLIAMWPQTSKQLMAVLTELHKASKPKAGGRLASVSQLASRNRVATQEV